MGGGGGTGAIVQLGQHRWQNALRRGIAEGGKANNCFYWTRSGGGDGRLSQKLNDKQRKKRIDTMPIIVAPPPSPNHHLWPTTRDSRGKQNKISRRRSRNRRKHRRDDRLLCVVLRWRWTAAARGRKFEKNGRTDGRTNGGAPQSIFKPEDKQLKSHQSAAQLGGGGEGEKGEETNN